MSNNNGQTENQNNDELNGHSKIETGETEFESNQEENIYPDEMPASEGEMKAEPEGAKDSSSVPNIMLMALIVEGGMVVLAVVIGWFGFCDSQQSLMDFDSVKVIQPAFVWGMISIIPLLFLLWLILKTELGPMKTMRQTVDNLLGPLFKNCSVWEIAILSLMAGFGEELLFRWCLQGGLAEIIGMPNGPVLAAVIVGILFGLCHFINLNYAIITTLIGIYLGMVMNWSGTYLAPAFSHAFFDFVALMVVIRRANIEEIAISSE